MFCLSRAYYGLFGLGGRTPFCVRGTIKWYFCRLHGKVGEGGEGMYLRVGDGGNGGGRGVVKVEFSESRKKMEAVDMEEQAVKVG